MAKTPKSSRKGSNHPAARLVRALKHNNLEPPKTKKDGTPFTPWADEVALRLKKKEEKIAAGVKLPEGRKCSAMTSGIHGPKRPCDRFAVNGLTVCYMHGGSTKAAIAAARKRLTHELDPTISRLIEIRDQNDHMPSALGAAVQIANRVMGKPDSVDKDKGAGKPHITIGIAIGAIPKSHKVPVLITDGEQTETIEAEVVDEG